MLVNYALFFQSSCSETPTAVWSFSEYITFCTVYAGHRILFYYLVRNTTTWKGPEQQYKKSLCTSQGHIDEGDNTGSNNANIWIEYSSSPNVLCTYAFIKLKCSFCQFVVNSISSHPTPFSILPWEASELHLPKSHEAWLQIRLCQREALMGDLKGRREWDAIYSFPVSSHGQAQGVCSQQMQHFASSFQAFS